MPNHKKIVRTTNITREQYLKLLALSKITKRSMNSYIQEGIDLRLAKEPSS